VNFERHAGGEEKRKRGTERNREEQRGTERRREYMLAFGDP
jgi:hypothetical protein